MNPCPKCQAPTQADSRFCPSCGEGLQLSERPTELSEAAFPSAPSIPAAPEADRFSAGTVLAGRYRIVGKLGKGGMGEVYRADDLTLGQPVALKFLSERLANNPARLEGLLTEVRIARQVSHRNVCRVYDIVDVDGYRFLSMEYVDGEDLGSLLRRIGRYSHEKALEIARQICAGLAAAHDCGVLHRDLKPANIMIDGRGQVRITDFGLAAVAGEVHGHEIRSGTPGYMAPEQISGREVTERSDIYSLGVVLYELFSGKPAHDADTREELIHSTATGSVTSLSSHVAEMDDTTERIIQKCLEVDPHDRPASVIAVAAGLPGGDPLAQALAAGETPSPEMVAAAGGEGALKSAWAWGLLIAGVVLTMVSAFALSQLEIMRFVDLPLPPAALKAKAQDVMRDIGHDAPATDTAGGMGSDYSLVRWIRDNDESQERWDSLRTIRPAPVFYWYRESPRSMVADAAFTVVGYNNPNMMSQGMSRVQVDSLGRLQLFEAVPERYDDSSGPWDVPDWTPLFEAAELDKASFTEVSPTWAPRMASDVQVAWEGATPDRPDVQIRIEAASYRGQVVSFILYGPWVTPSEMTAPDQGWGAWFANNLGLAVMTIGALLVGMVFAHRNVRAGRSDTRGALRLAFWFFVIHTVVWALWASHVSDLAQQWKIIQVDLGYNLFLAANLWLLYVGLEPYVRRRWPDSIIGWSRVLAGKFRDPLIGRDILIGGVMGGLFGVVAQADSIGNMLIGNPIAMPDNVDWQAVSSLRGSIGRFLDGSIHSLLNVMEGLFVVLIFRSLFRKIWIAGIVFALMLGVMQGVIGSDNPIFGWVQVALITTIVLFVLVRYGLVAATVGFFVNSSLTNLGPATDFSVWYAPSFLAPMIGVLLLLAYGFHTSLAGQPMFGSGNLMER